MKNKIYGEKPIDIVVKQLDNLGVSKWKINRVDMHSYQLYCVRGKIETTRLVDDTNLVVTVYADGEDTTGSSSFRVFAPYDEKETARKIEQAMQCARLIKDKPYSLVKDVTISGSLSPDIADYPLKQLACDVYDAVCAGVGGEGCTMNALEIFAGKVNERLVTSGNVDCEQSYTKVFTEAIPTCTDQRQSVELYKTYYLADAHLSGLTSAVKQWMRQASWRLAAQKPTEKLDYPVIFGAQELYEMLAAIVSDSDFATVYSGSNRFSLGDSIADGDCPLTVTLKGRIDGCTGSRLFDDDGVIYRDVTVIQKGRVMAYHGSNRFAQYLGMTATGNSPCMEVAAGSVDESEMTSGKALRVYSMSGIQVDVYGDYIGGEVRLAVLYDGKKTIPVTGISLSGKLSEVLATLTLSSTTETLPRYKGPSAAKAEKLTVY